MIDGKTSLEGGESSTKIEHDGNKKAIEMTKEVIEECDAVSDPDRCEFTAKLMACGQQSSVKHGLDPKKLI